ncbi:hypothetical protein QW060_18175 [Myroides ceti]|uniref:Cyclic GMP-AMP synthase n=1 Tax=Paenimyroides ceti TaxID=395087 RepID=A0ABT8CXP3_9FLAO|nr:hypothetical protein [Paenimyroides ceti]MDN3709005.1 hypothetical protein [Paenimyroides ceti]
MKENDFNLNIPRYVDTFEEEPEVDIKAVQLEITKIEKELKEVQLEMNKYLKDLNFFIIMITTEQKTELEDILDVLGENLSITESQHEAAVRSYKAVGSWLTNNESKLAPYSPVISPQGSFIIGTIIQTIDPDGDMDLDIVCELNGKKQDWTQKDVKEIVGEQLAKHKKYESILDEEGRRCWTLKYRENGSPNERYHMDILPAINTNGHSIILEKAYSNLKDQKIEDLVLSITDNERLPEYEISTDPNEWLQSNPFGYAKWFMGIADDIKGERTKMFSLNESVNPTPKYQKDRLPLQRLCSC